LEEGRVSLHPKRASGFSCLRLLFGCSRRDPLPIDWRKEWWSGYPLGIKEMGPALKQLYHGSLLSNHGTPFPIFPPFYSIAQESQLNKLACPHLQHRDENHLIQRVKITPSQAPDKLESTIDEKSISSEFRYWLLPGYWLLLGY
jgi:hypothetical protein